MLSEWFESHPRSVGETYFEHQRAAFGFSCALLKAGLACFIHGLCPALFQTTASRAVAELHAKITARHSGVVPVETPADLKRLAVR